MYNSDPLQDDIKRKIMNVVERAKAPTPKFFKVLRTIGLALLAVSGSIVAAPVALPAVVVTVAGYAAVAGGVLSAVSQITVEDKSLRQAQQPCRIILSWATKKMRQSPKLTLEGMDNSLTLKAGTFGGFALSVIPNLTSADVLKTIVLAFIGAVVSFGVTLLLKQLTSKKK